TFPQGRDLGLSVVRPILEGGPRRWWRGWHLWRGEWRAALRLAQCVLPRVFLYHGHRGRLVLRHRLLMLLEQLQPAFGRPLLPRRDTPLDVLLVRVIRHTQRRRKGGSRRLSGFFGTDQPQVFECAQVVDL